MRVCVRFFAYLALVSSFGLGSLSTVMAATGDFSFRVNTFGTLGLASSDSDTLGFIRDYQQKEPLEKGKISWLADSNLGVQFNARYKKISGGIQLLARDRTDNDLRHLINYAYLDVQFGHNFIVRVGKNPLELYLSSDNRAVGYSQLLLRPVSEFYAMLFEESYPGIDARYSWQLENGILTLEGFTGTFDISFLPENTASKDYSYDPMVGVILKYSTFDSTFLLSYLWANVTDVAPLFSSLIPVFSLLDNYRVPCADRFADIARIDDSSVHYFIAGASTQLDEWTLKGEVNHFMFKDMGDIQLTTGYLLAGYVWGEWTPYGVIAGVHTKKDKLKIPLESLAGFPDDVVLASAMMNSLYERVGSDQISLNLGVRWDFRPGMAMKAQWGTYHVKGGGVLLWDALSEKAYDGGNVNIFSASLDFAF